MKEKSRSLSLPHGANRSVLPAKHVVEGGDSHVLVNLLEASRPERQFSADDAFFEYLPPLGYMHFMQRALGGGFRSSVTLRMSSDAIARFAETSAEFMQRLANNAESGGWPEYKPEAPSKEPDQAVTLSANAVSVQQSSTDTYFDFYLFDPSSLKDVVESGHVAMDGVVRVIAPSHAALAVLSTLMDAAHILKKQAAETKQLAQTVKGVMERRR